jgi:hypothetical protein
VIDAPLSGSLLSGISCVFQYNSCEAVGSYPGGAGSGGLMFADGWNGSGWTKQSVPSPPGASSSTLAGVSCYEASDCFAAGSYVDSAGAQVALVDDWGGGSWVMQNIPLPAGARGSELNAVSCVGGTLGRHASRSAATWTAPARA